MIVYLIWNVVSVVTRFLVLLWLKPIKNGPVKKKSNWAENAFFFKRPKSP